MAHAMNTDGQVGNLSLSIGHERAMDVDDSVLWSRARSGDAEAFGMLFERHGRTIYNYCFRRVGSWSVAEDLVSIVFLEAAEHADPRLLEIRRIRGVVDVAHRVAIVEADALAMHERELGCRHGCDSVACET